MVTAVSNQWEESVIGVSVINSQCWRTAGTIAKVCRFAKLMNQGRLVSLGAASTTGLPLTTALTVLTHHCLGCMQVDSLCRSVVIPLFPTSNWNASTTMTANTRYLTFQLKPASTRSASNLPRSTSLAHHSPPRSHTSVCNALYYAKSVKLPISWTKLSLSLLSSWAKQSLCVIQELCNLSAYFVKSATDNLLISRTGQILCTKHNFSFTVITCWQVGHLWLRNSWNEHQWQIAVLTVQSVTCYTGDVTETMHVKAT